jgi:uncharacterized protein YidB (DUF937 family)
MPLRQCGSFHEGKPSIGAAAEAVSVKIARGGARGLACNASVGAALYVEAKLGKFAQEVTMGLIDVLNGMQNGPRGQRDTSAGGGGMSPITMAILGLLAYKAVKGFTGGQTAPAPGNTRVPPGGAPMNTGAQTNGGGGLGDLIKNGLGGLLATGAAGSIVSGGLGDLLKQLQQNGHGEAADSWVGTGPNKTISPNDLADALGADKVNTIAAQTGMSRDDLLQNLSEYLPKVVDQLTPQGRLPTDQEAGRML